MQGPWGDAPGVQDKEAGEQSENESEGRDRAGGAWGHSSNRRRGRGRLTWSEVYKTSLLCFAENRQQGGSRGRGQMEGEGGYK